VRYATSPDRSWVDARSSRPGEPVVCAGCGDVVVLRSGKLRAAHFAHRAGVTCPLARRSAWSNVGGLRIFEPATADLSSDERLPVVRPRPTPEHAVGQDELPFPMATGSSDDQPPLPGAGHGANGRPGVPSDVQSSRRSVARAGLRVWRSRAKSPNADENRNSTNVVLFRPAKMRWWRRMWQR
jgi:hypothetical protein